MAIFEHRQGGNMSRSSFTNSVIENVPLPTDGALFYFPKEGKGADCIVHLDGVYMTAMKYRGVRGQIRLWVETKRKRLRWRLRGYCYFATAEKAIAWLKK